jgi:predicted tellurium resistance membrane protein TerC
MGVLYWGCWAMLVLRRVMLSWGMVLVELGNILR